MSKILIVPGLYSSGASHWQSWFEQKLPNTFRVEQDDWSDPYLPRWAGAIRHELDRAKGHVWIIAHSFGCLAAAHASTDHRDKVAGVMFVAPADPDKFEVTNVLPAERLGFPSVVVASSTDPWMRLTTAAYWADLWGSRLISIGNAGHINVDSGFGPWPDGLAIFEQLRRTQSDLPLGSLDPDFRFSSRKTPGITRKPGALKKRLALNWNQWLLGDAGPDAVPAE
ncbi:alpha/beta hydrolase [Uliginosibacterium sp. 31-16]|uniref:RBBP9/YdeN family alpha/beta hydrolase n=1 Tax=Uliginosibacterium sp. 31-16 TaxID=3068315 RepID=UPI00273F0579|nr:alpha/beta hydrolase [Uliginosibacterium sp. 31-16]MDP5239429.1 alpha/beta hydrolase [Uliginosibacterium sp. 31-16]